LQKFRQNYDFAKFLIVTPINNLSVSFGGEYLFKEIAFRLNAGDRVGLIGKNGAGKSTLLKLLSKEMSPDSGTLAMEKDIKIGCLKQDLDFEHGRSVLDEAYEAFVELKALEQQLEHINLQLAERTDYESDLYNQLIIDLNLKESF
jgi:ATP-binding cassette subfamily F protein 3